MFVIFVHLCYCSSCSCVYLFFLCSCVHRVRPTLLFQGALLELLLCLFCVCIILCASALLLSCCCFLPTALLPLFYSVLNISNRYFLVYFFANIMICKRSNNLIVSILITLSVSFVFGHNIVIEGGYVVILSRFNQCQYVFKSFLPTSSSCLKPIMAPTVSFDTMPLLSSFLVSSSSFLSSPLLLLLI